MSVMPKPEQGEPRVTALITADEAYPALEQRMMAAQDRVVMGFRIFDPSTRLRSPEAQSVGKTWVDLLAHTLSRGVDIDLALTDFDPVAVEDWHQSCWKTMRILCGVREMVPAGRGRLRVRPMLHPARLGPVPHVLTRPMVAYKLRKLAKQSTEELRDKPGVRRALNDRFGAWAPSHPVSHHQKLAVFDDEWLYIGGLDLDERRYDTPDHDQATQCTWHDVQLLLNDPDAAKAARTHLETFGAVVGANRTAPETPGLLRTLSSKHSGRAWCAVGPKPVRQEILDKHLDDISKATDLVYLETQFFRFRPLARALAARAEECPDLRLILIMPGAPESVAFEDSPSMEGRFGDYLQLRCLRRLRRSFGPRLVAASPVQPRPVMKGDKGSDRRELRHAPLVYLHAKVSIFDTSHAIVSSANLNGRSMKWDSEAGVSLEDTSEVRYLRDRLLSHWLPDHTGGWRDSQAVFETVRDTVNANAQKPPHKRNGFLVPYGTKEAAQSSVPLVGVPEEMV